MSGVWSPASQDAAAQARSFPLTSDDEVAAIGEGVLARTLPKAAWTHEAHCTATVYFLTRRPDIDLPTELPRIIRAYNEATGVANSDTSGYHHTITQFYILAVRSFLPRLAGGEGLAEICNRLIASPFGRRDFPLRFYSRQRLFSVEARRRWVEPDLHALVFDNVPTEPDPELRLAQA